MSIICADVAIEVRHLKKIFRVYEKPSDVLSELLLGRARAREMIALDDLSLVVRRGETLGIVGRNGAGKSTLLKIIAGTLVPTSGTVTVNGRIAAILELGSGFHSEFTGRENIYMGGFCLGLTREEIDEKLESIIEFSELRPFIDQPLRIYSTGMQARLSFSVATSVDPEIMIVDEALSVGDARFQLKCFGRFEEMRLAGKTVLIVSHNMNTITSICDRAILLEHGRLLESGEPKQIDMTYHRLMFGREGQPTHQTEATLTRDPFYVTSVDAESLSRFGTGVAQIIEVGLIGTDGNHCTLVASGERCRFFLIFRTDQALEALTAGFLIRSPKGVDLFGVDTTTDPSAQIANVAAGDVIRVELECSMWLAAGEYFVTFALALGDGTKLDARYDELLFRVASTETLYTTSIVNLNHRLRRTNLAEEHGPMDGGIIRTQAERR